MENVQHTREDILNKDFKNTRIGSGYDKTDVDAYLDEIMGDYQIFQNNIDELQSQNEKLKAQVAELTKQVNAAQAISASNPSNPAPASAATNTNTNMDILKRLSNLERRVFGTVSGDNGTVNPAEPSVKPAETRVTPTEVGQETIVANFSQQGSTQNSK
ncbi:DivIVA domain-containing protein [Weissella uvarum]|uniref:cell division regulator GpsB n=1 Tax=Weissella uvarum TaxID=1479233 RepID=UPI00196126BD|nr:cell division regulator GpsB [Weissella uvarum]MBM7617453.1 DivIVA domain-containing protein [Weissella uvarum]MCM0595662.1 cell division regulator GpsB [Weissella uvarum]